MVAGGPGIVEIGLPSQVVSRCHPPVSVPLLSDGSAGDPHKRCSPLAFGKPETIISEVLFPIVQKSIR